MTYGLMNIHPKMLLDAANDWHCHRLNVNIINASSNNAAEVTWLNEALSLTYREESGQLCSSALQLCSSALQSGQCTAVVSCCSRTDCSLHLLQSGQTAVYSGCSVVTGRAVSLSSLISQIWQGGSGATCPAVQLRPPAHHHMLSSHPARQLSQPSQHAAPPGPASPAPRSSPVRPDQPAAPRTTSGRSRLRYVWADQLLVGYWLSVEHCNIYCGLLSPH